MTETKKTFLIGLFVIAAIACVIWVLMFLNPTVGDGERTLRVRFSNIDKVTVGTRVTYAGKPVGEVIEVVAVSDARELERPGLVVYPYELLLSIDSSIYIYDTDEISIRTSGLLGERNIAITPKRLRGREPNLITNGGLVWSEPSASVEETVSGFTALAGKVEVILDQLYNILDASGDEIDDAVIAIKNGMQQLETVLQTSEEVELVETAQEGLRSLEVAVSKLNDQGFFEEVSEVAAHTAEITKAINQPESLKTLVDNLGRLAEGVALISERIDQSWPLVDEGIANFAASAKSVRDFTDNLSSTEGAIGKFVNDDGVYLQVRGILTKAETLMDDINHYGVLFHLDRGWQRQRTRRANQMADLSTAAHFRNYFQEEVDQIDTSLSRVARLLEKTECCADREDLLNDCEFTRAFRELLRRVQAVEERLESYNADVGKSQSPCCGA